MIVMPDSHHIATNITAGVTPPYSGGFHKRRAAFLSDLAPITTLEQVILAPRDKGDIY
jgi:hypothetical protein